MARKLPVYLLLDVSGSMMGEPIEAVKNGVQTLVSSLRSDPYALETAYLSVITFGSTADQVVPMTELTSFQSPPISASGSTAMGAALKLLAQKIDTEVTKNTAETKGDWKPQIFLLTDGAPTDDWQAGLAELKARRPGIIVACAVGGGADTDLLKKITENVVVIDNADSSSIKAFFKWVSASISTSSQKIDTGKGEAATLSELPPPPPEVNVVT